MAASSPNRFRALENVNDSEIEETVSDANLNATTENAVKSAMEEAVACTKGSRAKKKAEVKRIEERPVDDWGNRRPSDAGSGAAHHKRGDH